MKKSSILLASGLLGCTLATTSAHAAPATGSITSNTIVISNNYLTDTVKYSAQNNTPTDGTLELNDQCYVVNGGGPGQNYYLHPSNPLINVPIASSQNAGTYNKGPWTLPLGYSVSHGFTYRNDVVLTAVLGSPTYRVQFPTNNATPVAY